MVGIALPILTYQFGIKPSQDALKDFEKDIDRKIDTYLFKTRDNQINQALENIKSKDIELRSNAITYLSLTQHQGFTDEQLFKLFQILKSKEIDQITKGTLSFSISTRKNEYATEYLREAIQDPTNIYTKVPAIRYLGTIGIENHLDVFQKLLSNSTDKNIEFCTILNYLANVNNEAIKILINNNPFVDLLDKKSIEQLKLSVQHYLGSWRISEDDFQNSYLKTKLEKG